MSDKDLLILADLDAYNKRSAMTQARMGELLGVSQGHLSKVMSGKIPLSDKLRVRVLSLLNATAPSEDQARLELEVLRLLRTSEVFRGFMHSAIKMHNSSK